MIYSKEVKPSPYAKAVQREAVARDEKPNTPLKAKVPLPEKQKLALPDQGRSCKRRPEDNKGSGGSRPWVPWCSRFR